MGFLEDLNKFTGIKSDIMLTQDELTSLLPQSYPFMMIDRVIELISGQSLRAIKNITGNEWIFQNQNFQLEHLPEPFLIEAAAQAALILYAHSDDTRRQGIKYLGKVTAHVRGLPLIGDQLAIEVRLTKLMNQMGLFDSQVSVNGTSYADIQMICGVK